MNVVVYTLTRDRLWSSRHCLPLLRKKAGVPFHHIVVDNGSTDGTVEWLENEYKPDTLIKLRTNTGISFASNLALDSVCIGALQGSLVIKVDNDCEVVSENIIGQMVEIYEAMGKMGPRYVLSPRVDGINRQPARGRQEQIAGRTIGLTAIVGGLFHCVPPEIYTEYRFPENMALAHGQDDHFCDWVKRRHGQVGYVEGLRVNHYLTTDGQCQKDRPYFERKWQEEKTKA